MNTRCFRLIFSRSLGFLIPVAEITRARRKPGQPSTSSLKPLALSLLLAGLPSWAVAEIVVDSIRPYGTNVISAPNGVPVIEIAAPNNSGLSHNRFTEFDVRNPGVIYNNSLVNGVSQLGGAVLRNPNLVRTARAILTEVTGNNPSSISGTLEVFGDKADLFISNPNGLTLNGVTTLNTSSLTVSAGHVRDADSSLQFVIDEHSGQVLIGADGVYTAGLSYFDIVARSVALQGAVGSQTRETDLQIAAGQGAYDVGSRGFTAAGAQGSGLAISGSAAGAMHGRFINLISSDSGAGVRHEGLILAARDIAISADGDIQLKDTGAGGRVQIASTSTVTNTGTLDDSTGLTITANDLINRSGGYLGSGAGIHINTSNSLLNELGGTMLAQGDMQLRAGNSLSNAGGIQAGDALTLSTQGALSNSGLLRGRTLNVSAGQVENRDGGTLYGEDTARLNVSGDLTNQSGSGIYAQNTLTLEVLGAVLNDAATIAADTLSLNAASLTNRALAQLLAEGDMDIDVSGALTNDGATVAAGKALNIAAGTTVTNTRSAVLAGESVRVKATDIRNASSAQIFGDGIELVAKNSFSSETQASIQASRNLSVDADSFVASASELLAGNNLLLNLGSYQNSATITSFNNASLTLKNNASLLIDASFKAPQAANLLTLSAHDVTVTDELNAAGSVQINATGDMRNQGTIIVGNSLGIDAEGLLENQAGKLIWAGENLILQAGTDLLNAFNSQLLARGDISLTAGRKVQNNVGRIEAQKNLWIDAPLLENLSQRSGGVAWQGNVAEDAWYSEADGLIERDYWKTHITLPVYASNLTVKQGVIKAGGDLLLNQDTAKNTHATVRNVGGLLAATGNVLINGNVENIGISASLPLLQLLKDSPAHVRMSNSIGLSRVRYFDENLYQLLERMFTPEGSRRPLISSAGGKWRGADESWVNSLKSVDTPEINQVLSAVLGADWKALNQKALFARWAAFKDSGKNQQYYADTQAEISAGKTFLQSGGSFASGDGTSWGAQRPITIQVGSETVQSVDGELASRPNVNRDWAQTVLEQQKNNPLFRPREPSADDTAFARVKPIYETRVQYIDQSQFLGSEYFLDKIGYDPQKSVTVLGDAYFDNQLILQSVQQRLGNFFAQTQRLSDADLVQRLMNNGAELFVESGFTLGQPLTPAQIAGLKNDVVWYENQLIDGQLVLAPRLYLSQQTLAARDQDASGAALVGADTILIDAESVANINGTIRGSTDTFIYSKTDINNVSVGGTQAGIFAGQGGKEKAGQLVIAAEGKVLNQGGIMSGFQQTVVGGEGVTSSATTGYDKNGYLVVRDNGVLGSGLSGIEPKKEPQPELAQPENPASKKSVEAPDVRAIFEERLTAGPVDASQGSSLSIISGGDINLTGAITQSDNVLLQTTGDLNMRDLHEARSAFDSVGQTGFLSQVDITEMASSANSVGNTLNAKNLVVKTAGDWGITGGEINTETSAVEVGGDMTVAAGKDLAFHEKTVKTVQLVIGGGVGAGGYEANAMWGSAANVDTQLASPFDGQGDETSSVRSHASAGRSASSQALATEGTGGRTGANKGRGATSGANVKIGLEMVTTTDTTESSTYRNAQLNLGSGSVDVGGTFDFGGADINAGFQLSPEERAKMTAQERIAATEAMPTLDIKAGDIKTTKYESTEKTSHSREELFFGFTAEAHSSLADVATQVANTAHKAMGTDAVNDPNAPAGSSKTLATQEGAMEIDPALTAIAAAGLATQVAFGEVIGASRTLGMQHTKENRESESRAENINQVGGNISLTSTHGDIALNGVNLQGGKVAIKSAGNLTQQAAKSSSSSKESVTTHRVGISDSIGVSPTGAGMGISVGADGSYDETKSRSTSYQNGLISGTEVSIETAGDHTMIGSNIKGNQVTAKIGGNQTITSVQDTSTMDHTRGNWSASVGIAITTNGLIQGTGSFSASGGKDFDNSKLVAEQAGISADSLSLDVAKNLNLTGAHITSKQGTVDVGGKITAQTLHDSREKDGGYGGGGAGISKNGLPSATFEFGRVDQVKYHADNAATIDVGDPSHVSAKQGISGKLNTDASKQLNVTQNKRVAGTEVKIEVSISDAQEIKDGVKKLVGPKSAGSKPVADAPSSRPRTSETRKTKTADPKPAYDQRVIVNTDTSNPIVNRAVQNLANKHPDNSVVITPTANGGHSILQGALAAGGNTKVAIVGHGASGKDGTRLGILDGRQITELLNKVSSESTTQVDKVALVGCGTACSKDGNSLVNEVRGLLQQQGANTQVRGYETPVLVDPQGHVRPTKADTPDALANGDPKQPKDSQSEPGADEGTATTPQLATTLPTELPDLDFLLSPSTQLLWDDPDFDLWLPGSPPISRDFKSPSPLPWQQSLLGADASFGSPSARKPSDGGWAWPTQMSEPPSAATGQTNPRKRKLPAESPDRLSSKKNATGTSTFLADDAFNLPNLDQLVGTDATGRTSPAVIPQVLPVINPSANTPGSLNLPDLDDLMTTKARPVANLGQRSLTQADMLVWKQLPQSQRSESGIRNWLNQNGIQPADSRYLSLEGISKMGRTYKRKLDSAAAPKPPASVATQTPIDVIGRPRLPPAKPDFNQRVIVHTDINDAAANRVVQALVNQHPHNSVVIAPQADGAPITLHGSLAQGGATKLQVVGHNSAREGDAHLGGLGAKQLSDLVETLSSDGKTRIDQMTLVSCGTACAKDGSQQVAAPDTSREKSEKSSSKTPIGPPVIKSPDDIDHLTEADLLVGFEHLMKRPSVAKATKSSPDITLQQIKAWSDMTQEQREASGGWSQWAAHEGIDLTSAKKMLLDTGLTKRGSWMALKESDAATTTSTYASGRKTTAEDLQEWLESRASNPTQERASSWLKDKGIGLNQLHYLSADGLTLAGKTRLNTLLKKAGGNVSQERLSDFAAYENAMNDDTSRATGMPQVTAPAGDDAGRKLTAEDINNWLQMGSSQQLQVTKTKWLDENGIRWSEKDLLKIGGLTPRGKASLKTMSTENVTGKNKVSTDIGRRMTADDLRKWVAMGPDEQSRIITQDWLEDNGIQWSEGNLIIKGGLTASGKLRLQKATSDTPTAEGAAQGKPTFDQRVIVNTDTQNLSVNRAVENLANKHPNNTVVITPNADGGHTVLQGAFIRGGTAKVDVVGHGKDSASLGGLSGKQITDLLQNLKNESAIQVDKLALVGCGTACAKDGKSLVNEVSGLLQQQGATASVKGYENPVVVNAQGRKIIVEKDTPGALGKGDPKKPQSPTAGPSNQPLSSLEHRSPGREEDLGPLFIEVDSDNEQTTKDVLLVGSPSISDLGFGSPSSVLHGTADTPDWEPPRPDSRAISEISFGSLPALTVEGFNELGGWSSLRSSTPGGSEHSSFSWSSSSSGSDSTGSGSPSNSQSSFSSWSSATSIAQAPRPGGSEYGLRPPPTPDFHGVAEWAMSLPGTPTGSDRGEEGDIPRTPGGHGADLWRSGSPSLSEPSLGSRPSTPQQQSVVSKPSTMPPPLLRPAVKRKIEVSTTKDVSAKPSAFRRSGGIQPPYDPRAEAIPIKRKAMAKPGATKMEVGPALDTTGVVSGLAASMGKPSIRQARLEVTKGPHPSSKIGSETDTTPPDRPTDISDATNSGADRHDFLSMPSPSELLAGIRSPSGTIDTPRVTPRHDSDAIDNLTVDDLLVGFEHLAAPVINPGNEAETRENPPPEEPVKSDLRLITKEDLLEWDDLPYSEQSKTGITGWLAKKGILRSQNKYLTKVGLSERGQERLEVLSDESGQLKTARQHSKRAIDSVAEKPVRKTLANSDLRLMTKEDMLEWKGLPPSEQSKTGITGWLANKGILPSQNMYLSKAGLSGRGQRRLKVLSNEADQLKTIWPHGQGALALPNYRDNSGERKITEADLRAWSALAASEKEQMGVEGWLATQGIRSSHRRYLSTHGLSAKGQQHLLALTGEGPSSANQGGRNLTATDMRNWSALDNLEKLKVGIGKWLETQGIDPAHKRYLSKNGLSSLGERHLRVLTDGHRLRTQTTRRTRDQDTGFLTEKHVLEWQSLPNAEKEQLGVVGWLWKNGLDISERKFLSRTGLSLKGQALLRRLENENPASDSYRKRYTQMQTGPSSDAELKKLTVEDLRAWEKLASLGQNKMGSKKWLADNGFQSAERRLLTRGGISTEGKRRLENLTGEKGAPITKLQKNRWKAMTQDERNAAGGLTGWARVEGISLESARAALTNTGLTKRVMERELQSTGKPEQVGRTLAAEDFQEWLSFTDAQRAKIGIMPWLREKHISPNAHFNLTLSGLRDRGQRSYDNLLQKKHLADMATARWAQWASDLGNPRGVDVQVNIANELAKPHVRAPGISVLPSAPNRGAGLTAEGSRPMPKAGGSEGAPADQTTSATASADRTSTSPPAAPAPESATSPQFPTTGILNALNHSLRGELNVPVTDRAALAFARFHELVDDTDRLTPAGAQRLQALGKERRLFASLSVLKERLSTGQVLTESQINKLTTELAAQHNIPAVHLRFYLTHPHTIDTAIDEINKKWRG